MEDIILLGIGGHAHSVVDSIEQGGIYNIIGFLDTKEMQGESFRDYHVLNTDDAIRQYFDAGIKNAFITIGFMGYGNVRNRLYAQLKDTGFTIPNIIDRTAVVSDNTRLEEGIFIGKRAVLNSGVRIGKMCIVNTGAIVEHDCLVEEFSHVAVGGVLCGGVKIGRQTLVGANAVVIQGRKIGSHCVVGAGVTMREDMEDYYMMDNSGILKIRDKKGGGYSVILRKRCAA